MRELEPRVCVAGHRRGAGGPPPPHRRRAGARAPTHVTVAIDTFLPALGGAQSQLFRLTPLFHARGIRTSVVTRRIPAEAPRHERASHVEIVRIPGGDRSFVAMAVARIVAERPHVVHARGLGLSATAARVAARTTRRPYVLSVLYAGPHGDIARLRAGRRGEHRWRRILRTAAAFVCLSGEVVHDLRRAGVDPRRIVHIPSGVDIAHFRPGRPGETDHRALRAELGLPEREPLTLTVGPLEPSKRIDRLIAAHAKVPGVLVVVGDGPEAGRLRTIAASAGIADRVLFRPATDDVAPYMRLAAVYVTASGQDGLSNAVLEAMASGLPVVAALGGGVAELVDATTGVLVASGAPDEIGRAVVELLRDPERRRVLGAAGRQRVVTDYTLTRTADQLAALYERLRR
jgi:glycosyltransferase involved in cell wall biosynthesis